MSELYREETIHERDFVTGNSGALFYNQLAFNKTEEITMCNLSAPHFHDKNKAREYLENLRWGGQPVCPHCGGIEKIYTIKGARDGLYKCGDCRKQFTVTVGTVFENSRVPLNKWLAATYLMASSKKGVSSKQLERTLGVTYKTAWFMSHRIREAMKSDDTTAFGSSGGAVEG